MSCNLIRLERTAANGSARKSCPSGVGLVEHVEGLKRDERECLGLVEYGASHSPLPPCQADAMSEIIVLAHPIPADHTRGRRSRRPDQTSEPSMTRQPDSMDRDFIGHRRALLCTVLVEVGRMHGKRWAENRGPAPDLAEATWKTLRIGRSNLENSPNCAVRGDVNMFRDIQRKMSWPGGVTPGRAS